jgi:hypothetical protein
MGLFNGVDEREVAVESALEYLNVSYTCTLPANTYTHT